MKAKVEATARDDKVSDSPKSVGQPGTEAMGRFEYDMVRLSTDYRSTETF